MSFEDRSDAGRHLAQRLAMLGLVSPVVLGLPRGGIPVAAEIAAVLGAPLEVFVAHKVGAPGHEELSIGALAEGLAEPVVSDTARQVGVSTADFEALAQKARRELERRVDRYRGDRLLPDLHNRDVIVVDDGMATGVTAEAAVRALRAHRPRRLLLAVGVCARQTAERLGSVADEVVCAEAPAPFFAVGQWYRDFSPITDDEVVDVLERSRCAAG